MTIVRPRTFDQTDRANSPEWHQFRMALSNLLNSANYTHEDITDLVATAYAGDWCQCCRPLTDDFDPTCWPHKATVKESWLHGTYRCPRTGRVWTCGYTTRAEDLP